MAREKWANSDPTTLNGTINNSTTSVVVTDASTFPSGGNFRVLIDSEIMICTSRSSNTLTVLRGQEGTTGASHTSGVAVNHVITAGFLDAYRRDLMGDLSIIDSSVSLSTDDDDFDDDNFSGWTTVQQTSPTCTITEKNHKLSILFPASVSDPQTIAIIKNKTPSAGDYVQAGFSIGGAVGNYPVFGLTMSKTGVYNDGNDNFNFWFSVAEQGYFWTVWRGFNTRSGTGSGSALYYPFMHGLTLHMRLVFESNDHYSGYISPDGVSWAKVVANVNMGSMGGPPHYLGITGFSAGAAKEEVYSANYCRFSF